MHILEGLVKGLKDSHLMKESQEVKGTEKAQQPVGVEPTNLQ